MNTNALCAAVAVKAAAAAGIRGASALLPDTIPGSPWAVVGPHRATYSAGNMDRIDYTFPIGVYVERTADDARAEAIINNLVDAFVTAFRNGLTYGGTVAEGRITGWDTNLYAEVGGVRYWVVEFSLAVTVLDMSGHTP